MGLLIACLYTSIEIHGFNKKYYENKYTELNTAEDIGMSNDALFDATFTLLDYLKDKRDDIHCVQEVNGVSREIFDERETAHMIDVKELYINVKKVCISLSLLGLLSFLILLYFVKFKGYEIREMIKDMMDGLRQVVCAFAIVISGLLFYAFVDFSRFWTMFHEIFFDNDLWLLDPRVSIMINMFPENFWFGMVIRMAITFIVSFCGLAAFFYWIAHKRMNQFEKYKK